MFLLDYLFVDNINKLALLALIVFFAGIVRGCIGFAFSALVVASTSLWLDVKFTVIMVIFLEITASIFMLKNVKKEIDYPLLKTITISSIIASFVGVWGLANMPRDWHQILISVYLMIIALISLTKFEFKTTATTTRLTTTGLVAGFYNGFAGLGGILVAAMLNASHYPIKNIRATMVVYFFFIEVAFFIGAYLNDLVNLKVFFTSTLMVIPMVIGIVFGSKLFHALPDKTLKQIVLITLLLLSVAGLIKTLV